MKSSDDWVQGSIARSVQIPLLELTVSHQTTNSAQATVVFLLHELHFLPPQPGCPNTQRWFSLYGPATTFTRHDQSIIQLAPVGSDLLAQLEGIKVQLRETRIACGSKE